MRFIQSRDAETTPAQYANYLQHQYDNAKRHLAAPDVQWGNGSSHEFSRAQITEINEAYQNLVIDEGFWTTDGKFSGFQS